MNTLRILSFILIFAAVLLVALIATALFTATMDYFGPVDPYHPDQADLVAELQLVVYILCVFGQVTGLRWLARWVERVEYPDVLDADVLDADVVQNNQP